MTSETKAIAKTWFDALDKGDMETALGCLDPNIVWINVPKIKDGSEIIPWIGTANGIDEVINQFSTRDGIAEVKEFKPIGMCCEGSTAVGLIRDKTLILIYKMMVKIRLAEERIAEKYSEQKMRCPTHLCIGQEAVSASVGLALKKTDYAVSTHRSHGHY